MREAEVTRIGRRVLVSLLAAFVALMAADVAAAAPKYVYWTEPDAGIGTEVNRATVDGGTVSDIRDGFINTGFGPCGVAVNATHIFWANSGSGTIGRALLDGTDVNQSFITAASSPCGVAVNGTHIFWANRTGSSIGRAGIDGSAVNQTFLLAAGFSQQCGVDVDANFLYAAGLMAGNGVVVRAPLDGSNAGTPTTVSGQPCGVAVNGTHRYWASHSGGAGTSIGRMALDGTGPVLNAFIVGLNGPCGIAVDSEHIFFANEGTDTIGQAALDGSSVNPALIPAEGGPCGVEVGPIPPVAVADTDAPETDITKEPKRKTEKRKAKFKFVADEAAVTFECKFDRKAFAPCVSPLKKKVKADKKHKFKVRATDAAGNADPSPAVARWKVL